MLHLTAEKLSDHLQATAWLGAVGILTSFVASRYGFFRFREKAKNVLISTPALIELLLIYFIVSFLSPLLLIRLIMPIAKSLQVNWSSFLMVSLQLASEILIILLITLYAFAHKRINMRGIFKTSRSLLLSDFGMGALTWAIAFPVVAAIDGIMESINIYFFGSEGPSQIAVEFIRMLANSSLLWLGLLITIVIAPFIEEFIFRGVVQTYLRKRVTRIQAIVLSSIFFAGVHFAPSQGIGNIPLLVSIFSFGLYLGFIYERQGSLLASFSLHATFNALSIVRILYAT